MTDKQEDFCSMLVILYGFLTKFPAVISSIPAFQRAVAKLGTLIEEIKEVDSGRESIISGKSDSKSAKRNELVAAIYNAASSLYTYADEKKIPDILNRVNKGESYYKRMRDTNLIMEAKDLAKLTVGIEEGLADHGLSSRGIAQVTVLATAFEASMKEVGTSEAEGAAATKSVYELIGEAKNLVDNQLNIHAAKFKTTNTEFYSGYLSASRVISTGVRHEKKEETTTEKTTS
jgi:hypothetical protein